MMRKFTTCLLSVAVYAVLTFNVSAAHFDIPAGNLKSALNIYMKQTGVTLMYAGDEMAGAQTHGTKGDISADTALLQILNGTVFAVRRDAIVIEIVRDSAKSSNEMLSLQTAAATAQTATGTALETVTVTSS